MEKSLTIQQGVDWKMTLQFVTGGAVMDLTGCTVRAEARKIADRTTPVAFVFTCVVDTVLDVVTVTVPKAVTEALTVGKGRKDAASLFYYDFKLIDSLGNVTRPLEGTVSVSREITN